MSDVFISTCVGEGMGKLSLADRATIANMSPEYGATMGFFPVDHVTLEYLKLTGRSDDTVGCDSLCFTFLMFNTGFDCKDHGVSFFKFARWQ